MRFIAARYPNAHIDEATSLPRAYQRAVTDSGADHVWHFLRSVFGGCEHTNWFKQLSGMPWRRIWTLNIDDAFENAYRDSVRQPFLKLRSINWTDDYAESGDVELVHLHGTIATTDPSPLVFSFTEYHGSAAARPVWHQVFRGVTSTEPLVILGARVLDDPDVEALILASRPRNIAPSVIVDPFINDGNAWELEQAGFVIVRATAEDFIRDWQEAFDLRAEQLEDLYGAIGINLPQMNVLTSGRHSPDHTSHDFLGGSEPNWHDASSGLIAEFEWMTPVLNNVSEWAKGTKSSTFVQVVVAQRLGGATSGALLVASHAATLNATVLWFDRSTRFRPEQVLDYCEESGPVVLVIDGGHGFAQDTDRLAALATVSETTSLFVLLLDRSNHFELIEDQLVGAYAKHAVRVDLKRTRHDANAIVHLLENRGRLGVLESQPHQKRIQHFRGRDIFSAMGEVEHAPGFRLRFDREVQQLDQTWQQDLVFLLALASISGAIVGLQEASFAIDAPVPTIRAAVDDDSHLSALVEVTDELIRPRQRERGIESLRSASEYRFLDRLASMLVALAPLDTRASHKQHNRAAVLVGQLMGARLLRQVFPDSDLQTFYELLRDSYGSWNARYWEQRAIDARMGGDLPKAESYAERAVTILDDAFTRTTLGTVLMYRATALATEGDPLWSDYYERALAEFENAANLGGGQVSSFALLQTALRVLKVHSERANRVLQTRDALEKVAADWAGAYAVLRVGLHDEDGFDSLRRAEDLAHQFDALTASTHSAHETTAIPIANTSPHGAIATDDLTAAIRLVVGRLDRPTSLQVVAQRVKATLKSPREGWGEHASFTRALRAAVDGVQIRWDENRGTVVPPVDHPPRHPRRGK